MIPCELQCGLRFDVPGAAVRQAHSSPLWLITPLSVNSCCYAWPLTPRCWTTNYSFQLLCSSSALKIQLSLSLSLRSLPVPGWIMWLVTWLTSSSWRTHPLFRWRWECSWRSSQIFGMKYSLTDTHTHTEPDVSLQGAAETWPVTQHYLFGPSTPWAFHHYYKCRAGGRKRADLNSVRHRRTSLRNKWPSRPRPLPVSAEQLFFTTPFTFLNS